MPIGLCTLLRHTIRCVRSYLHKRGSSLLVSTELGKFEGLRKGKFKEKQCKTSLDYWLFNLANMDKMKTTMPFTDKNAGLFRLNELAKYHSLSYADQERYLKEYDDYVVYNDVMNLKISEGEARGEARGRTEGRAEGGRQMQTNIAYKLKMKGNSVDFIAEVTGLSPEEIEKL